MEAYKWISSMYSLKSDNQKTLENRNLWLTSAKEIHDKKSIAEAHTDIGLYFDGLGNFQDALVHHNSALQSHLEWMKDNKIKENTNSVADCYHNIGNVNMRIGNYTNALKYYFLALKIREETKNRKGIGVEKEGIAHTYYAQNNFVDALANYTQALKIFEEFKDDYFTANCYANIGKVYLAQEVCPEARENILKSLTLREGIKHKPGISESHLILAAIYLKEKKSNEALNHAFKCLKIAEQINNKTILAAVKLTIGKVYMSYPDSIVIAKKYVKEAISISEEISLKTNLEASYRYLAEINYKEQNYESAYHSFRKSSAYNDSLTNRNVIEKLAQLRMQYDFDKKEDSLNYQQQITGEQLKQQTLFSQQQQQSLLLKEKELALISKEKDLQELEYFKTQAELQVEQSKRKENEDQLTIAEQEKSLQKTKLDLQTTQLGLQNKELQAKKTQRNIFIAGTIALLLLAFFIFRNYQNQQKANKLMKVAAEKERIELQLQSLRAQLNPHFMFNSLNAIQELIVMEENEKSQSYLERFAKLLRMLLENANEPFIPLRKEVNFLELYLSLEKLRLPDLEYSIEIDPQIDQQKAMTPNMMLQPYVENALWHGLQHKQGEKNLQLHIVRQNGSLTYEIKDNGVGRKKAEDLKSTYRKEHRSKGMELLSQRFNLLSKEYGQNIQTTITDLTNSGNATGTLVKITIPYSIELDKPAS